MTWLAVALVLVFLSCCKPSAGAGNWCYQSQYSCNDTCYGPGKWSLVNSGCAGKKQSPVNIVTHKTVYSPGLKPFIFEGYDHTLDLLLQNTGYSVQVNLPSTLKIKGSDFSTTYKAVQLHLHWGSEKEPGSEHLLDGEQYSMELHIVHMKEKYKSIDEAKNDSAGLAVLGFLYEESQIENANYKDFVKALGIIQKYGQNTTVRNVQLSHLLLNPDEMLSYYRYNGSLTTPDCSEAVTWTVFTKPIGLSSTQLTAFTGNLLSESGKVMQGNFRPVQKLYGRTVYQSNSRTLFTDFTTLSVTVALGFLTWPY
ncbi:carbonic anhydrase 4-like [Erpetoichthys calabaricus]|uniref:carbonic anhydrase 4-like n=1 Tax=Erpetoichthys calabaricus TaxID=27687 RepID=UPI00109F5296|nr:carbonic anhydrase 4-like [Erpetoichthys calabaricus]